MKNTIFIILFLWLAHNVQAQHCSHSHSVIPEKSTTISASDTFDILHTELYLDFTNFSANELDAHAEINAVAQLSGVTSITFDLLGLNVDSVFINNSAAVYSQSGEKLIINLPTPSTSGDTLLMEIHYRGTPTVDNSGWGGFYFSGGIAYNLGVGFEADPHSYGRTWHPCFDNFVERSTYTFHIRTQTGHYAQANGVLTDTTHSTTHIDFTWELNQSIPSYLAGIGVGPYAVIEDVYNDMTGRQLPIVLAGKAADTANLRQSFVHLHDAIACYEQAFGPYLWDKVGYILTGQGAMEHATNVAYPRFLANGNTQYENIMAHELAHHWWGDLVTCETAEDMWINEGMAEFCSHLFYEYTYDYATYLQRVKSNHYDVLLNAHIRDDGFRSIYGIPHDYTYGDHVYYKGAMAAHNLRGYLGDSLFFSGLQHLLDSHRYDHINTTDFETELSAFTGVDLNSFFQGQILNPGFSTFTVDSFAVQPTSANYQVTVWAAQRLRQAPQWFNDVPVTVSLVDDQGNIYSEQHSLSGATSSIDLQSPIEPVFVAINMDGKLNMATTDQSGMVSSTGPIGAERLWINATVDQLTDSSFVYMAHHWSAPGGSHGYPFDVNISQSHYWEVRYSDSSKIDISGSFKYDGRAAGGLLDADLVSITEDSLVLLYRTNSSDQWTFYPFYTKNVVVNSTNAFGRMEFDRLLPGEYALANIDPSIIGLDENNSEFRIHPNPSDQFLNIQFENGANQQITVTDIYGRVVLQRLSTSSTTRLDISNLPSGNYFLSVQRNNGKYYTKKFTIIR